MTTEQERVDHDEFVQSVVDGCGTAASEYLENAAAENYRAEAIKEGLVTPTFSEFYNLRHERWPAVAEPDPTGDTHVRRILEAMRDYLDQYGPGAR